ncbi:MAG TPA: nuclear transport factor 2 family protein [Gemmatimonadaceae bacterium]|nr:nuclear transport factor 2 family protein [Gemmatimonadaceae bacterium]
MKCLSALLTITLAGSTLHAQPAPAVAASLPAAELADLDRIRKDVWVNWFGGDTAALRRVLTPDLVAISPDQPHWQNLEQTLAASAGFRAGGGRLRSVDFDSTTVHRFGDVVVIFSHYRLLLVHEGQETRQRGRATEVFVRHRGRWVHTSWQLDTAP